MDILGSELSNFDVICLSETWFNSNMKDSDVMLDGFRAPFRNDRITDNHGGVAVYVKSNIACTRRTDLEIQGIECVWIEIRLKSKRLLVGTFYRPLNSDQLKLEAIDNSIDLAIDPRISDIIISGDFNFDMLNGASKKKISNICQQYDLHQTINAPTHFTENSSSLLDIMLVTNNNNVLLSGVGEPFLHQDVRYHCPVFSVFKFTKPNMEI